MTVRHLLPLLLVLAPPLAFAQEAADYARQWPITLPRAAAGAYRLEFSADVHRTLVAAAGDDFAVLDAAGRPVPAMRVPAETPVRETRHAVPFFALPRPGPQAGGWTLDAQADADGRLRRVQVRGADGQPLRPTQATLLVDASAVPAPVAALEFDWAPSGALDQVFEVSASDDLQDWRPVPSRGRLLDLPGATSRLLRNRLAFDTPVRARYLRLLPTVPGDVPGLRRLDAVVRLETPAPLAWRALPPRAVGGGYEYTLAGRWPVSAVDVAVPGDSAQQWQLASRDDAQAPWQPRARWNGFHVRTAGGVRQSPPQGLGTDVRASQWRLEAPGYAGPAPTLRLGYRPQALVFVAQGPPPYRLVAGSARRHHADAALGPLLDTLRANAPGAAPAPAQLGSGAALAGGDALQPRRDWRAWLLWGVLALGAATVAGFSLSLLRRPR